MRNIEEKHIVVVLGMHRSGTSVVTRGLRVLGVELGNSLLSPAKGVNDKGFWEDADITALDDELLSLLGHDWHTVTPIRHEDFMPPGIEKIRQRAVELLRVKLGLINCFGLKDPRISRLLPFWKDVFSLVRARVSYIIAYRHPTSVARSLAKRDGFDHVKSYILWLDHMVSSLGQTQGHRRVVVNYDQLMNEPERQLARVANALELPFDAYSQEFADYRNNFLDDTLRHTCSQVEHLQLEELASPSIAVLNSILTDLAADRVKLDDSNVMAVIERLSKELIEDYAALRYMRLCEERAWVFSRAAAGDEQLMASATELLRQKDGYLAITAAELLRQKDEYLATAAELLRQKDEHLATAAELLRQKDEHLATAAELIRQRDDRLARSIYIPWRKKP